MRIHIYNTKMLAILISLAIFVFSSLGILRNPEVSRLQLNPLNNPTPTSEAHQEKILIAPIKKSVEFEEGHLSQSEQNLYVIENPFSEQNKVKRLTGTEYELPEPRTEVNPTLNDSAFTVRSTAKVFQ